MKSRQLSSRTSPLEHKRESSSSAFWQISSSLSAGISHQHPSDRVATALMLPHAMANTRTLRPHALRPDTSAFLSFLFFSFLNGRTPVIPADWRVFNSFEIWRLQPWLCFELELQAIWLQLRSSSSDVFRALSYSVLAERLSLLHLRPSPTTSNPTTMASAFKASAFFS